MISDERIESMGVAGVMSSVFAALFGVAEHTVPSLVMLILAIVLVAPAMYLSVRR